MTRATYWVQAARPKTLFIALSPVTIGAALALRAGSFDLFTLLMTLVAAFSIQIGANFASDYFDFISGADHKERKGPRRLLVDGLMEKQTMVKGMIAIFAIATLSTLYLIQIGGPLIALTLALSIGCALLYTAGPFSFANLGIGDYVTLLFFGPIAVGITYYLQTGQLAALPFVIGLSPGLFSSAILNINNLRDVEEDRKVNRRTLPVRLGLRAGEALYLTELIVAILLPVNLLNLYPLLLLIIPTYFLHTAVRSRNDLNRVMGRTAQLELLFALLFSLCLFI